VCRPTPAGPCSSPQQQHRPAPASPTRSTAGYSARYETGQHSLVQCVSTATIGPRSAQLQCCVKHCALLQHGPCFGAQRVHADMHSVQDMLH
jgi:hypothetical protein